MSYILNPIAVDLKKVVEVFGSKNKRLIATLIKNFEDEFDQIDEMAAEMLENEDEDEDEDEDGDGKEATTVRDAITQMVMGQKYDDRVGFVYGYALEFICRHFGEGLSNDSWSSMRSEWARKADKALKSVGVAEKTLRVSQLMNRGAPVPLPMIEDFPGIGYMTLKEIEMAVAEFTEEKLDAVKDDEVREALSELRFWLWSCEDSKKDLICFYA
ncbi:DUF7691 family protein [Zavarzinella formosa]|uniref:DUF7691 family protein n=1 Tax=Zavarzinella formosa TaxID=360055 RepID=UPI0002D28CA3|nr:hypothetical protein [Zavarzinella formosa]